jgi:hypothetical protein
MKKICPRTICSRRAGCPSAIPHTCTSHCDGDNRDPSCPKCETYLDPEKPLVESLRAEDPLAPRVFALRGGQLWYQTIVESTEVPAVGDSIELYYPETQESVHLVVRGRSWNAAVGKNEKGFPRLNPTVIHCSNRDWDSHKKPAPLG